MIRALLLATLLLELKAYPHNEPDSKSLEPDKHSKHAQNGPVKKKRYEAVSVAHLTAARKARADADGFVAKYAEGFSPRPADPKMKGQQNMLAAPIGTGSFKHCIDEAATDAGKVSEREVCTFGCRKKDCNKGCLSTNEIFYDCVEFNDGRDDCACDPSDDSCTPEGDVEICPTYVKCIDQEAPAPIAGGYGGVNKRDICEYGCKQKECNKGCLSAGGTDHLFYDCTEAGCAESADDPDIVKEDCGQPDYDDIRNMPIPAGTGS